eukprot:539768-Rhodomonas_salina.1
MNMVLLGGADCTPAMEQVEIYADTLETPNFVAPPSAQTTDTRQTVAGQALLEGGRDGPANSLPASPPPSAPTVTLIGKKAELNIL